MNFCKLGTQVIALEAQAVANLAHQIDEQFAKACELILTCSGRVVVTGMGKSGHIANKIAATMASTGTPAFFMHPGEASHGDLGMITRQDIVIAISNSGETNEIITLLPMLKRLGIPLIAMTGNQQSTLATSAGIHLDITIEQEACPLGLAPTTSTTVALVMGDALAVALLQARGFTAKDFAMSHPGGSLGRRLFLCIDELCHRGEALPVIHETATIRDALIEVTAKKLGMTCVIDSQGQLCGVYTDGDIRRTLNKDYDINSTPLSTVMTRGCKTIKMGTLATDALNLMRTYTITSLVVINDTNEPVGVIHLHDLLRGGII